MKVEVPKLDLGKKSNIGLLICGLGFAIAFIGSRTNQNWVVGAGAIAMFGGFVFWRKLAKQEKEVVK